MYGLAMCRDISKWKKKRFWNCHKLDTTGSSCLTESPFQSVAPTEILLPKKTPKFTLWGKFSLHSKSLAHISFEKRFPLWEIMNCVQIGHQKAPTEDSVKESTFVVIVTTQASGVTTHTDTVKTAYKTHACLHSQPLQHHIWCWRHPT